MTRADHPEVTIDTPPPDPPDAATIAAQAASWRDDSAVPATHDRLTLQLESLRALSAVRRQVTAFLTAGLPATMPPEDAADITDQTILVIDELASNALRHGRPPSWLHITDEPTQWIVVACDSAPDLAPVPAHGRAAGDGGYGLHVITDLTTAHGVHYDSDHKMVWATLSKNPPLSRQQVAGPLEYPLRTT